MGMVSEDLKRVLAFSTVSQLGFMMAALGAGGYEAGMFHLMTHAAFKALLFLCAGSVIHAVHTNDMWKMGGLKTKMPVTCVAYIIGTLAITGFPLLSGFYSKEAILSVTYTHSPVVFGLLAFTSLLTTFYMFRSLFLTFFGTSRGDRDTFEHAHESPALMTVPLIVLSALSLFVGFAMHYNHYLGHWIVWADQTSAEGPTRLAVFTASLAAFAAGLLAALWVYMGRAPRHAALRARFSGLYDLLAHRYYIDDIYLWFIDRVYHPLTRGLSRSDDDVIDRVVDGNAGLTRRLFGAVHRMQSGLVQSYLFWMVLGLGAMAAWVAQRYK
jgi:NADH-quinone oxidoreductase subunit L